MFILLAYKRSNQLLVESTLTYFCYIRNSSLVYCYRNSTHYIYPFTFNSDILSFFMKGLECTTLVKISDSVLDSALAPQGKEGDIVREKL